jgi:hypothetical protein
LGKLRRMLRSADPSTVPQPSTATTGACALWGQILGTGSGCSGSVQGRSRRSISGDSNRRLAGKAPYRAGSGPREPSCESSMVRRGSTVRVRQRALTPTAQARVSQATVATSSAHATPTTTHSQRGRCRIHPIILATCRRTNPNSAWAHGNSVAQIPKPMKITAHPGPGRTNIVRRRPPPAPRPRSPPARGGARPAGDAPALANRRTTAFPHRPDA